jgi:hypothetical protein
MSAPPTNRRTSGRFEAEFECLCAGIRQKGSGVVEDISRSGALIGRTLLVPERGELVGLCLALPTRGCIVLIGHVARRTMGGFAIEFDHLDAEAERFVDDVAAIVCPRRTSTR